MKYKTCALCSPVSKKKPSSCSCVVGPGLGLLFCILVLITYKYKRQKCWQQKLTSFVISVKAFNEIKSLKDKWSIYLSVTKIKKEEFGESSERELSERSSCNDTMENEPEQMRKQPDE